MGSELEVIKLHDMEGISRLSGTDEHGCVWIQFEVDSFAEQEPGECCICGVELWEGWMCLDSGDEVCDEHIQITEGDE